MNYLVIGLYVISFALFIYGLMGLTGPKTAVRGNLIAAVGMALAVTATLIKIRHTESWVLIVAGLVVGIVLGALVVFGEVEHPSLAVQIILFVAVVFGTLNVIGGFIVTDRMLGMFKGKKKPAKTEAAAK